MNVALLRKLKIDYFKLSGKWYCGAEVTLKLFSDYDFLSAPKPVKRRMIIEAAGGTAPDLSTDGAEFTWVCTPVGDWGFPVLLSPVAEELARP